MTNYSTNKETKYDSKQTFLFYLIAGVFYGTYGGRVCPFLDTLTNQEVLLQVAVTFGFLFVIRHIISTKTNLIKQFQLSRFDCVLFVLVSLPLAGFYFIFYDFPTSSSIKVVFGLSMFGFFTGSILELKSKLRILDIIESADSRPHSSHGTKQSIVKDAITLVLFLLIASTVTLSLIAVKGMYWLEYNPEYVIDGTGKVSVTKELVYISLLLIGYSTYIMLHWRKLMKIVLNGHETALETVTSGNLSQRIPVYLNDELGSVASMTNNMLDTLEESNEEVQITRDAAIIGLSALAESRDNETGAHILRTQEYVRELAVHLSSDSQYQELLTDKYIELLYKSAPLHDVGKVGIPDNVLLKPGKLTDEEFTTMKQHAVIGADALSVAEKQLGSSSFLKLAKEIALTHHEKWNGSGYPNSLSGESIPLSGRLMALADVYDALISKRVYKPAFSHEKAKQIILEGSGTHFDPKVVEAFLAIESKFVSIALTHKDTEEEALSA